MTEVLLFLGGAAAGFVNTLASSGTAISLPILLFLGLPPHVANATNRLTVLAAACASTLTFSRKRTIDWRHVPHVVLPIFVGSIIGALIADWLPDEGLRQLIVFAVFLALVLALVGRRRMLKSTEKQLVRLGPVQISLLFLVGIWAGIIVLDSYTYLLVVLVLGAGYGLVQANALKVVAGIAMTVAALLVFSEHGEVHWKFGIIMSLGSMTGGWLGALIAANERSRVWVFRVLIVTIVVELIHMVTTR